MAFLGAACAKRRHLPKRCWHPNADYIARINRSLTEMIGYSDRAKDAGMLNRRMGSIHSTGTIAVDL